jgi:hypothetical protein
MEQEAIVAFHIAYQNKNKISSYVPSNNSTGYKSITCLDWLFTGFGLVIGFIGHLQNVTTSNYRAIANSHSLQFTTARIRSSQSTVSSPVVAWWRIQQYSLLPYPRSYRLATVTQLTYCSNCRLSTNWLSPTLLLITFHHGRTENTVSLLLFPIVAVMFVCKAVT